jgi:2',3'-cyclic-nucleotide 2'-phosphodiesterase/3'-nucleotidase
MLASWLLALGLQAVAAAPDTPGAGGATAAAAPAAAVATGAAAESVIVTVLATTDMHGHVYPYDYYTRRPAARGLGAVATLVAEVRRETPHTLLVDCGDTIQGSPLASVYQSGWREGRTRAPEPMMLAMSRVGYDAMVLGNHELNFGLASLGAARAGASFPWLSANTETGDRLRAFAPWLVKRVGGVKLAVIGITTPAIPQWEKPETIRGLAWRAPEDAVRRALAGLEAEQPDAVLLAVHGGLGREAETGIPRPHELPGENPVWELAERFPQLAAVVYGHSHSREPGRRVGGVLVVQPKNWAAEVARLDLAFERAPGARFRLKEITSRLLPVTPETPADTGILELARPYHEAAERYLERRVAEAPAELTGARGRVEDSALVDAIHAAQLHHAGADVSFTALFDTRVRVPRGPVTLRELAALYVYDNELYAVEGTGRMVREALENAARYFRSCPDPACASGPLLEPGVRGYNYDMAQGVEYEIDLRQPAGRRISSLRYRGAPLGDDQPLRIALNNYRAAGSAGYAMFREAKVVWRSGREIRELLAEYWSGRGTLPEKPDGNWRLLPTAAVETLMREEGPAR